MFIYKNEIKISLKKSFNSYLLNRIIQLGCNAVTNSRYSRREIIKVNPVPAEIQDDVLEASVCKTLSLTGVNVALDNLHACHRMKRSDRVIIKRKCRKQKQSVMYKRKSLGTKSQELSNLKFSERLFVSEICLLKISSLDINVDKLRLPGRYILLGFSTMLLTLN